MATAIHTYRNGYIGRPTPPREVAFDEVPSYASVLEVFHQEHGAELRAMIADLQLAPDAHVLDMACGAGAYTRWIAEELGPHGRVVGVDLSAAYLERAKAAAAHVPNAKQISFLTGDVSDLPFEDNTFDVVWCAQSLYSLPSPLGALRELRRVVKPGGRVAVFENDTFHQVILPWPPRLELAVRQAQLQSLSLSYPAAAKFFIGRQFCSVFAEAELRDCTIKSYTTVRHAPLSVGEKRYISAYLQDIQSRAHAYLQPDMQRWFEQLVDPASPLYLLHQPDFFVTYIDLVACGVK